MCLCHLNRTRPAGYVLKASHCSPPRDTIDYIPLPRLGCFKFDAKRDHDGAASSPRKDPGEGGAPQYWNWNWSTVVVKINR